MVQIERAKLLIQQSRYELAEKELRKALGDEPNNQTAHLLISICLVEQDKNVEATNAAAEAIRLDPADAQGHYVMALSLLKRNRYDEAEQSAREALRLEPNNDSVYGLLAQIKIHQRQWPEALDMAKKGLAIDAENAVCNNMRTMALERMGKPEGAIESARETLKRHPEDADSHATLGWSLLADGKYREAQESFREALRLEPQNEFARQGMINSLNASNPIFRIAFAYFSAMSRLSARAQWGIVLGLFIGQYLLNSLANQMPALRPFVLPIILVYLLFVVLTWTAYPVFNTFLRFNRFGKHLLDNSQRWSSNCVAAMFAIGVIGGLLAGILIDPFRGFLVFMYGVLMLLPISATFNSSVGWPRILLGTATVLLFFLGLFAVWSLCMFGDRAMGVYSLFIVGNVATQFLANFVANATVKE